MAIRRLNKILNGWRLLLAWSSWSRLASMHPRCRRPLEIDESWTLFLPRRDMPRRHFDSYADPSADSSENRVDLLAGLLTAGRLQIPHR